MMTKSRALVIGAFTLIVAALAVALILFARPWQPPILTVAEDPLETEQSMESHVAAQSVDLPVDEPPEPLFFTIMGGGDMLIHMPVADSAWVGDRWDFAPLMEPVTQYISAPDISICNMETPLVPRDVQPSGFPIFATPQDLAAGMAEVGWTGCSTSTNHSIDQGMMGIVHTLDSLDEVGMGHVGTARNPEEASTPQLYVVENGDEEVVVAHLSAADNLNGLSLPEDAPWAVQMIDTDRIINEARAAREAGADVVVVTIHCCTAEYDTSIEDDHWAVANALAESGEVDVMISHHAHVPKTIEHLEGGPRGEGMWAAFGLGNFISNQSTECCVEQSNSGLLAYFTFEKDGDTPPEVVDASWQVVTVDRFGGYRVYPLTAAGAPGSGIPEEEAVRRYQGIAAILEGSPAHERTGPPEASANTVTVIPRS